MNKNLHVFILKLCQNEWKISISNFALSLSGILWKMGKFENFITQVIKVKFEKKRMSFLFSLDISN